MSEQKTMQQAELPTLESPEYTLERLMLKLKLQ